MEPSPSTQRRVAGLDTLRFICAMWVLFSHGAAPPLAGMFGRESHAGLIATGIYNNLWNGQAAVIVFFVISGFCIHYPFAGTQQRPAILPFYTRRFLRLLIPVVVAIPLGRAEGVSLNLFADSVLWSLLAELIYYLLYPALRDMQLRAGSWKPLIMQAFAVSLVVACTNPRAGNYPSYGAALNWLLGLPCWLLGCSLAETAARGTLPVVTARGIWTWRAGVFALAWLCSALRYHTPVGFPWTLNFFALAVFAWLVREIAFRKTRPPAGWLEWAGTWSYSLYLAHVPAEARFEKMAPQLQGAWLHWLLLCVFALAASYLFYLIVEQPSHYIARRLSRSFAVK